MRSIIFSVAACISTVVAAPRSIPKRGYHNHTRALYTLSNDVKGARILALSLDAQDGQVSAPTLTSTGGNGMLGLHVGPPFGAPGTPAGPDGLFGHGAVKVSQNYLFTVNAGSKTLSLFIIDPKESLHPRLVGQPVDTQGRIPHAGIACVDVYQDSGLKPHGGLRSPGPEIKQKTPPTGPPGTGSEISFNPDSRAVLVSVKGSAGPPTPPSYIFVFPITDGYVGTTPVVSQISDLILDFSINFLGSNDRALITDLSFGASCWGAYSPRYDTAYVIDAGHTSITLLDPASGGIKGVIEYEVVGAKGGYDTVINREWLYTLTADSSVLVVQLEENGGKEVHNYSLADLGPIGDWQGIATWPQE